MFSVFTLCVLRLRFRRGRVCNFRLRLLLSFVSVVVKTAWLFLAEAQGSLRLDVFCVYSLCFEASLSQRPRVLTSGLRLMCSYVTLCG